MSEAPVDPGTFRVRLTEVLRPYVWPSLADCELEAAADEVLGLMDETADHNDALALPRPCEIVLHSDDLVVEALDGFGIRLTHLPTETVAESSDEDSQLRNKAVALRELRRRLTG